MKSLIKLNLLVQYNDGSTSNIINFGFRKEILLEYNIQSDFRLLLKSIMPINYLKSNKNRFNFCYYNLKMICKRII